MSFGRSLAHSSHTDNPMKRFIAVKAQPSDQFSLIRRNTAIVSETYYHQESLVQPIQISSIINGHCFRLRGKGKRNVMEPIAVTT